MRDEGLPVVPLRENVALRAGVLAWVLSMLLVIVVAFDPTSASATMPMQLHGALQRDGSVGVIAHRGAAALAPENTLSAFRLAIEQEVEFVETDVQLTADGVPVLMHDPEVDRTTSGHGALADFPFAQLRALDAGSWFDPAFAGEQVPTFEEFIEVLDPAPTRALVELKGEWPVEKVEEIIELLRSHNLVYRVVLSSFERDTLEAVRDLAPEYATILLTRELDEQSVEYAIELKVSGVCARDTLLAEHPRSIERLREGGIGAIAYTLNTPKQWQGGLELGIDFFVTDDPPALAAWRARFEA